MIGILVGISRRVGACNRIPVAVLADSGVYHVDTVRAVKDPAPTGIQIDLTDSTGIIRIDLISRVQSAISANGIIVHREGIEIPDSRETLVGKPACQIIQVAGTADISDLLAVVNIDDVPTRAVMSSRVPIDVLEGFVTVLVRMKSDFVLLQHPSGVYSDTLRRHTSKVVRLCTLVVREPAEEDIAGTVRNCAGGIVIVVFADAGSVGNSVIILKSPQRVGALVGEHRMAAVFVNAVLEQNRIAQRIIVVVDDQLVIDLFPPNFFHTRIGRRMLLCRPV